jgi:predicted NUDIX family phosphoesterase
MSAKAQETILCAKTTALPKDWLPEAGFCSLKPQALLTTLAQIEPIWLPRQEAETDPKFKQFIPYVVVRNPQHEIAAYPRKGTEVRLHGLWSIGIGGHVNPIDAEQSTAELTFWERTLHEGLRRELAEEFPEALDGKTTLLGIIHERRSEVGRVHLGVVFLHEIGASPTRPGDELAGMCWLPSTMIGTIEWPMERFELWSQLSLQLLLATDHDTPGVAQSGPNP